MGEHDFKETPERREELNRLQRMHDAIHGHERMMLPPPALTWFWAKYHQEDELEREFGKPIPKFDWTFTDEAGTEVRVGKISTLIEAVSKAMEYWKAAEYKPVGVLHAVRSDGKRFD